MMPAVPIQPQLVLLSHYLHALGLSVMCSGNEPSSMRRKCQSGAGLLSRVCATFISWPSLHRDKTHDTHKGVYMQHNTGSDFAQK